MTTIYRVAGDVGASPVGVVLDNDGTPVDLSGESLACYLSNRSTGAVIEITGLTGDSVGAVSTPLSAANLIAGVYTMEWEVVNGATYPGNPNNRPILHVRPEVS